MFAIYAKEVARVSEERRGANLSGRLLEEANELAAAFDSNLGKSEILDECVDVLFYVFSIAQAHGVGAHLLAMWGTQKLWLREKGVKDKVREAACRDSLLGTLKAVDGGIAQEGT